MSRAAFSSGNVSAVPTSDLATNALEGVAGAHQPGRRDWLPTAQQEGKFDGARKSAGTGRLKRSAPNAHPRGFFRVLNAHCPCSQARLRKSQRRLQLVGPHNGAVIGVRTDAFRPPSYDKPAN